MIATVRQATTVLLDLQKHYKESLEIQEQVDIVNLKSDLALPERIKSRQLDVLFVNAGISRANELTTLRVKEHDYVDMILTNA